MQDLLITKNSWIWGISQTDAFNKIKDELTSPSVLAWYNSAGETKLTADASACGLGAVPVAYVSRSMTEAETRYIQIKKKLWPQRGLLNVLPITFWENKII